MKSFFIFLGVLLTASIAFGLYVLHLDSCSLYVTAAGIDECHKLYLAFGVLFTVAIMLALGAAFFALVPPHANGKQPGRVIFDSFMKTLPAFATLVLGYYFGSSKHDHDEGGTTQQTQTLVEQKTNMEPKVSVRQ